MKLLRIETVNELRKYAAAWDDLWWRSDATLPTQRADLVAQWVEHFAPSKRFVALVVEDGGQLVAALPLVGFRKLGLQVGGLTANCWSDSGTLLLDGQSNSQLATETLIQGVQGLGWPLLMLDGVNLQSDTWQTWQQSQASRGFTAAIRPKYRIGKIDITHNWDAYVKAWSANHRRAIKKLRQAAEKKGRIELVAHTELLPDEVEPLLHQAFEIEDRSWKGREGSSVLRTPGAYDFFLRQAQQLATWNQFELYFLKLNDRPIAFDFCFSAKGVLSSHKIGYDEEFRDFGPFQLLRSYQLEKLFAAPDRHLLDTLGILGEANAKWSTRYVQSSRAIVQTGSVAGRLALSGYERIWPGVRKLLRRDEVLEPDREPGAARLLENSTVDLGEPAMAAN
mgnify:CR=1 FL=1